MPFKGISTHKLVSTMLRKIDRDYEEQCNHYTHTQKHGYPLCDAMTSLKCSQTFQNSVCIIEE